MVQLRETSPLPAEYAFTKAWDTSVRKNYGFFTDRIRILQASLQRGRRYFLSLSYPLHFQRTILDLELLQRKRDIGEVAEHELERYQAIEPQIKQHYKKSFKSGGFNYPYRGLLGGFFLLGVTQAINTAFPVSLFLFGLSVGADYLSLRTTYASKNKANEFLQWLVEYRRGKSLVELNRDSLDVEEYKRHFGDSNSNVLFEQLTQLLSK